MGEEAGGATAPITFFCSVFGIREDGRYQGPSRIVALYPLDSDRNYFDAEDVNMHTGLYAHWGAFDSSTFVRRNDDDGLRVFDLSKKAHYVDVNEKEALGVPIGVESRILPGFMAVFGESVLLSYERTLAPGDTIGRPPLFRLLTAGQ